MSTARAKSKGGAPGRRASLHSEWKQIQGKHPSTIQMDLPMLEKPRPYWRLSDFTIVHPCLSMFILSLLATCTRRLSQKWRGSAKLCFIDSCLVRLMWYLHIVMESDLPNLPNLHSNVGYWWILHSPASCMCYMYMVDISRHSTLM